MRRPSDEHSDVLIASYQALLDRYGPGHRAVQWSSEDAQQRRFEALAQVVTPSASVMDIGCGLGDLLGYLRAKQGFTGRYLGLDFVPEFIDHAQRRYNQGSHAQFERFDARHQRFPGGYDHLLISGTFNNLVGDHATHLDWVQTAIVNAFAAANQTLAFNSLSTHVRRFESDLFYSDPAEMFTWCAEHVSRKLSLRHDYNAPPGLGVPVDYTIYLFK